MFAPSATAVARASFRAGMGTIRRRVQGSDTVLLEWRLHPLTAGAGPANPLTCREPSPPRRPGRALSGPHEDSARLVASTLAAALLVAASYLAVDLGEAAAVLGNTKPLPLATAFAAGVFGVLVSAGKCGSARRGAGAGKGIPERRSEVRAADLASCSRRSRRPDHGARPFMPSGYKTALGD